MPRCWKNLRCRRRRFNYHRLSAGLADNCGAGVPPAQDVVLASRLPKMLWLNQAGETPAPQLAESPFIFWLAKRLHGHLWSFPAQPVLGPCFSTGFGMTVIDSPRVPTAYGGRDAGGMGGFGRVNPC